MATKGGLFRSSEYTYEFCKDCTKEYTPLKTWAIANFFTVKQCRRLLRNGDLLAMRYQGKMFVSPAHAHIARDEC